MFLGNDNLHAVTAQKEYTLRIDLGDFEGATRYALYPNFTVASESDNFTLYHGLYSGTAGECTLHVCMCVLLSCVQACRCVRTWLTHKHDHILRSGCSFVISEIKENLTK